MFALILAHLKKDLLLEWRMKYALNGILLHIIVSVLLVFLSVKLMNAPTWNAVFWLILLFASVSAVAKGFLGESKGRLLYYYTIASPQHIILSKIIFNALFMAILALVCFCSYAIVLNNLAQHTLLYLLTIVLGSIGFAVIFTLVSSISSKSGNGHLLMPVLSFPVIIPLLLIAIKTSKKAMDGLDMDLIIGDMSVLLVFNIILGALAYLLFPYLWKE
jgi:heme exporter protein B